MELAMRLNDSIFRSWKLSFVIFHLGRGCRHLKPGHLDKWLVVYEGKQKPIAHELINTLYNVCTPMVNLVIKLHVN